MSIIITNLDGYVPHLNSIDGGYKVINIEVSESNDPEYGKSLVIAVGDSWGIIEMVGDEPFKLLAAIEDIVWGMSQKDRVGRVKTQISGRVTLQKQKAEPWSGECVLNHSMRFSNTLHKQPVYLSEQSWAALVYAIGQFIEANGIPIAAE